MRREQAKIRQQEAERRRKDRVFTNKLIKMKNLGVTDVLRKFERFMRERGESAPPHTGSRTVLADSG